MDWPAGFAYSLIGTGDGIGKFEGPHATQVNLAFCVSDARSQTN